MEDFRLTEDFLRDGMRTKEDLRLRAWHNEHIQCKKHVDTQVEYVPAVFGGGVNTYIH